MKQYNEYNRERLKLLKQAKIKMLESQLQYQNKQGASDKIIHQTMKDLSRARIELKNL